MGGGGGWVGADGLDVEADGEALLRGGYVEEGGADDAVENGVGVVERFGAADEAVEELLVLMEGDEVRALAEEEVNVAGEAGGGELGAESGVEVLTEGVEVFGRERPGVAFGGEDGGARGVERAEGVHDGGEQLGLGEMIEVVGVVAEIDEVVGRIDGIRPRHVRGLDLRGSILRTIRRASGFYLSWCWGAFDCGFYGDDTVLGTGKGKGGVLARDVLYSSHP